MSVRVTRLTADPAAMRASIGGQPELGYYLVWRGEPEAVLAMLREVLAAAELQLPEAERPLSELEALHRSDL